MSKKICILQPFVPHYRDEFFQRLRFSVDSFDIYIYEDKDWAVENGFNLCYEKVKYISKFFIGGILFYSPWQMLSSDVMVLMLHFAHVTTWFLLLTKWLHRRKVILWGQGISVKRFIKEEIHPDWKLKLMVGLADGVWLYTEKECEQWKRLFPEKPIVSLNNSITGVDEILNSHPSESVESLKRRYKINEEVIFIFCARFESQYRRVDLLLDVIERLDVNRYGFIIVGDGRYRPDFSKYTNVHDFGVVYDNEFKRDLFSIADLYFQPGWVGLSIVEAMAYGKPVLTFRRSEHTLQCVEYSYIREGENGLIFDTVDQLVSAVATLTPEAISQMGVNAKSFVRDNIRPKIMVQRAASVINEVTQL